MENALFRRSQQNQFYWHKIQSSCKTHFQGHSCSKVSTWWLNVLRFEVLESWSLECFRSLSQRLSLEDLALVECFTHVFEVSFPSKVLLYHCFALLAVRIQLAPVIRFIVNLPVWTELGAEKSKNIVIGIRVNYLQISQSESSCRLWTLQLVRLLQNAKF